MQEIDPVDKGHGLFFGCREHHNIIYNQQMCITDAFIECGLFSCNVFRFQDPYQGFHRLERPAGRTGGQGRPVGQCRLENPEIDYFR